MDLSPLFDYISNINIKSLNNIGVCDPLLALAKNSSLLYVLYRQPMKEHEIKYINGDLLIGFIAKQNISYVEINKYELAKDEFVFAIDDQFIIPLINLVHHDIF